VYLKYLNNKLVILIYWMDLLIMLLDDYCIDCINDYIDYINDCIIDYINDYTDDDIDLIMIFICF
jgi:hypothetical protein